MSKRTSGGAARAAAVPSLSPPQSAPRGGGSIPVQPLALWVGPEATVNRVGDRYFDQLEWTGFARRPGDLDRIAALGATHIRFPLLWERPAPAPDDYRWDW